MNLEASVSNKTVEELLEEKLRRYNLYGSIKCILYKKLTYGSIFMWENIEGIVTHDIYQDKINNGWKPLKSK